MSELATSYYDTRTIIVNLLKEDKETYLSISRLHKLLHYIYVELTEKQIIDEYQILFDVSFDSIERTVIYNTNIFSLDIKGEKIYLREPHKIDELARKYKVDDIVGEIIREFIQVNAA